MRKNDSYMIFLKIQLILEIQKIRNPSPDPHVNTNMAPKPQDYIKKISNSNNFHATISFFNSRNTADCRQNNHSGLNMTKIISFGKIFRKMTIDKFTKNDRI